MATSFHTLLTHIKDAAVLLNNQEIIDLVSTIQQQTGSPRLRLLIAGTPGSGRFSLANVLLKQPGLLPAVPIPRVPLGIRITYNDTSTIEGFASDGITSIIAPDKLRGFLTSAESDATQYEGLHVHTNSEILKTCDVCIETIGARRTAGEWKELLANTDFVLLVLNAVALLSEQERRFIRDILQPDFGLARVAIIINKMDMVAADERASIAELVRTFLGSFESQPLLLELSAAQASTALAEADELLLASSGYAALQQLVAHDLLERHRTLKAAALRQASELCLAELETAVKRQQALLATDEDDLQKLLDQLDPRSQWLQARAERAQHRIEAFVSTLLKEQLLRDMEEFSSRFRQQLPDEILTVEKIEAIKRHLPGYIETVWNEFFTYQMPPLRNQLIDEMQQISDAAAADLQELLGSQAAPFQEALTDFDPVPPSMKAFIMPARGHHPAGTTATWMQVGGLALLLPFPQISLVLIGVGQAVRMIFQGDITYADKRALIASVINASYDLERQVKQQVERHFEQLAEELKQTVSEMYTQGVAHVRASLQSSLTRHGEVAARHDQVKHLANETVPGLRRTLEQLTGGNA
jgi:hypothetical protein